MNSINLAIALRACVSARRPAFVWGAPGIGKSQLVAQVAQALGRKLVDVRAVLLDPVDLRGIPHINGDNRAHWCAPDFLPSGDTPTLLFLDELNAAPALVQAACYQLILDRRLGDYVLPDSVDIISAGNRDTDRAVTSRMSSALANRFVHLTMDVDLDAWCQWAIGAGVRPEVVAFIRFRPNLLHAFDASKGDKAFPSPRSWFFVSELLGAGLSADIEMETISGTVGEGAAAELVGFLRIWRKFPNPDAVLLAPDTADVPADPATLYALTGALARRASLNTADRLCTYANRLPAEFSVLLVKDCIQVSKEFQQSRGFVSWASKHADVMF